MSDRTIKIRHFVIVAGNLVFIYGLYLFTQKSNIALPISLAGFILIVYGWIRFRPESKEL